MEDLTPVYDREQRLDGDRPYEQLVGHVFGGRKDVEQACAEVVRQGSPRDERDGNDTLENRSSKKPCDRLFGERLPGSETLQHRGSKIRSREGSRDELRKHPHVTALLIFLMEEPQPSEQVGERADVTELGAVAIQALCSRAIENRDEQAFETAVVVEDERLVEATAPGYRPGRRAREALFLQRLGCRRKNLLTSLST